jgi:hypothetical protein
MALLQISGVLCKVSHPKGTNVTRAAGNRSGVAGLCLAEAVLARPDELAADDVIDFRRPADRAVPDGHAEYDHQAPGEQAATMFAHHVFVAAAGELPQPGAALGWAGP